MIKAYSYNQQIINDLNKIEDLFEIIPFEYNKSTKKTQYLIIFPDNKKHNDMLRDLIQILS
jgi:hypothetical protein